MLKERKPIFQRSFIPKIFFVIVTVSLIITLRSIKKTQRVSQEALIQQKEQKRLQVVNDKPQIPEVHPQDITDLTLYVCDTCPYCSKVTTFLQQEKLSVVTKNVEHDPLILDELLALTGGKQQVPCLKMDDTHYLFESSEIIQQLRCVRKERPTLLAQAVEETNQI